MGLWSESPTRGRLLVAVIVALFVVGVVLLNLRVDRLWQNYPDQSGPCLTNKDETACRYRFVN